MNATSISYANGRFVPTDELTFPFANDMLGTLRGYRIFTSCRSIKHKIFYMDQHIDRLFTMADQIFMPLPHGKNDLTRILFDLLLRNRHLNSDLLFLIIYSGGPADSSGMLPSETAHCYVTVSALKTPDTQSYERGIALATYPFEREFATIKFLNYAGSVIAQHTVVKEHRAEAPLFLTKTENPEWLEGSTFNIFAVKDNTLITPPTDGRILPGITREVVLNLAQESGITTEERAIYHTELPEFQEVFITSSTRGALPVVRIDHTMIGAGLPGPISQKIDQAYQNHVKNY